MVSFEKHGRGSDRWTAIKMAKDWVSKDFAILDTETTGLGPHARIVEISCIDRDGNVLVDSSLIREFPSLQMLRQFTGYQTPMRSINPLFRRSGPWCGMRSVMWNVS